METIAWKPESWKLQRVERFSPSRSARSTSRAGNTKVCSGELSTTSTSWPQAVVIGTPVEGAPANPVVAEYEGMSLEERRAFWQQQFLKCIKCYGCRNICPVCFCEACAMEDPLWVEPGVLAPPFPMFHLIKAMHMSGRCVACRQCELTCPSHIPLTVLYDLIRRDVGDLLAYVPGADIEAAPPLSLTLEDAPLRTKS